jgi:hypothetical protein
MTNFPERDKRRYDYLDSDKSPMWIIGIIIVGVVIVGMIWNVSSGAGRFNAPVDQSVIQHMAQPPAPTTTPGQPSKP